MKKLLLASLCFLLLCLTQVYAQNRTVTGTVTAKDDGLPIPGVSVKIKGTSSGTQTNAAGKFSLSVPSGAVLSFSFIGYSAQDIAVGTKSTIDVTLLSANSQLNEVVVTALGIQRQAISVGYSTAKVSGKDLTQAKPISVVNGLTGKVSGLQISTTNNGLFAPTRVTLRGNRSLTGNNQPLYVVDGAIYYSDISTLNPEDIAETTVLKGSSASAVYGSDASNGVIVITTKHGTKGTSSLVLSSTYQIEKVSYVPEYQTRFGANGGEGEVFDFTKFGDGNGNYYYFPYENQNYGPEFNGKLVPIGRPLADGSSELVPYSAVKNQKKDFFDTGITTQHNFNFNSGDETGSFFMSGQDLHSKAIMPKDEGRRDVFRVGGDKKYGIFSTSYSAAYTYKTQNTTSTGAVYNDLIESPLNVPLADLKDPNSKYGGIDQYYNDYYISPGQIIAEYRNLNVENHIQANLQANLKVAKFLTLSYRTSMDNTASRYEIKDSGRAYSAFTKSANTMVYPDTNGDGKLDVVPGDGAGTKASASDLLPSYGTGNSTNILFSSDFLANYNFKLPSDFKLDGTLGVAYLDNKITATIIGQTSINFPPYNTGNFTGAPGLGQVVFQARKLGYFGTGTLGYKSYAFLHGSYRTDLDSRLSEKNKYIPYYDIDGTVVLSEIFKSIADNDYLNFVKIRYAHSLTGNASALAGGSQYIAFGAYQTIPTVSAGPNFPYSASGVSGYQLNGTIANPDIKPEKVTEDEIGLDLGFLKDRLTLTASAYHSVTKDGIVTAQISRASGFTSAVLNAANSENKGLELDLHGTVINSPNVKWTLGVNYTKQSSKVLSIVSGVNELGLPGNNGATGTIGGVGNTYAIVGLPYAQIKGYDWTRDPATGKVIVDASTGLPTRGAATKPLGNVNPTDLLGFVSSLTYKGVTLNVTIDYRSGYKIFNQISNTLDHSGNSITSTLTGRQRFVFPNSVYKNAQGNYVDNTNILTQDGNYNFWPTTYLGIDANYVTSAAAWKLREVSLNYNLPKSFLRDIKFVKNVNIALSGRNLLMFRPSTNKFTDPEFSDDNSNAVGRTTLNQAPPTRIFSGTLAVTF